MNDDKHPRVTRRYSIRGSFFGEPSPIEFVLSEHGTHKVVPADAIVIEAKRVPERLADWERELLYASEPDSFEGMTAEDHWAWALSHIAEAEHLRANPPVDEAEVQRLTKVLCDVEMDHPDGPVPHVIARRLYLAGVRAPEVTK